jgi:hypothetical protein
MNPPLNGWQALLVALPLLFAFLTAALSSVLLYLSHRQSNADRAAAATAAAAAVTAAATAAAAAASAAAIAVAARSGRDPVEVLPVPPPGFVPDTRPSG